MKNLKNIGTGSTIATFVVIAVTGVALFFGVRAGLIKTLHEYIGLVMVAAAVIHIVVNWKPFLNYFKGTKGTAIVVALAVVAGIWGYSVSGSMPKQTNWKKGMAYDKMITMDINTAMSAMDGNQTRFNEFLASKGIQAPQNISIKDFAKANKLNENELLDAMLK